MSRDLACVASLRVFDPLLALNVSAGTARFRQLSEAFRKTYVKRRETGKE